jgi:outer membrane immunogenic protein
MRTVTLGWSLVGCALFAAPAFAQKTPTDGAQVSAPQTDAAETDAIQTGAPEVTAPAPAPDQATPDQPAPAPAAPPVMQPLSLGTITTYGTLGMGEDTGGKGDEGIFSGAVGARFGPYLGVEADLGTGIDDTNNAGKRLSLGARYAGYIVAYLPLARHFDLFAKFGLGRSHFREDGVGPSMSSDVDSTNWGVGAQYFFTDRDGVRTEILREDYRDSRGERNSVNISWIHRF